MKENIYVRLVSFPTFHTKGATRIDADGNYNIYIDERLSCEQQKTEFEHELRHINGNHFRSAFSVRSAEKMAECRPVRPKYRSNLLCDRLMELRKYYDSTTAAIASELHVAPFLIEAWESGKAVPSSQQIEALASVYAVSAGFIENGTPDGILSATFSGGKTWDDLSLTEKLEADHFARKLRGK